MSLNHNPLQNSINAALTASGSFSCHHGLASLQELRSRRAQLQFELSSLDGEIYDREYKQPFVGPTREQLDKNPALKNAWEAYEVIRKLGER